MTLSPKARFLQDSVAAKRHADIFGNPEVQNWMQIAFAEYCNRLPPSRGSLEALDANSRREGAREYVELLLSLSSQLTPRPRQDDNLPHISD
jgi:hypothetical protein